MGNDLIARQESLSAADIRAQVNLIQEVMKCVMKADEHYGIIPGCQKPSLWKPGAEKLLMTFRIASEPIVEDLSSADEARFRVIRRGTHANSGLFLGSGVGECSSNEDKFKWRKAICDAEFEATAEDRRRIKWGKSGNDVYQVKQVRVNSADVANTILKMADKRAYVALALNVTAASDIFAQDIEDLPEGMESDEPKREPIAPPKAKAKPAEGGIAFGPFIPAAVSVKEGEGAKGKWVKYGIKGHNGWLGTFDKAFGELAQSAKASGKQIQGTYKQDGEYKTVVTLEVAEG